MSAGTLGDKLEIAVMQPYLAISVLLCAVCCCLLFPEVNLNKSAAHYKDSK